MGLFKRNVSGSNGLCGVGGRFRLVKNNGVSKLIVVVNKMDDPTVNWAQER